MLRLPNKILYMPTITMGKDITKYHVVIYSQPYHRWLLYELYHFYDMRLPLRVPGYKWFINKYGEDHKAFLFPDDPPLKNNPFNWLRGWGIGQDLRCYHLGQSGKEFITNMEVPKEIYAKLTGN